MIKQKKDMDATNTWIVPFKYLPSLFTTIQSFILLFGASLMCSTCTLQASSTFSPERIWKEEGWKTDFKTHKVPLEEILSGGPGRDGIPPIYKPKFESIEGASQWLRPSEPVIVVDLGNDSRAYPLRILTWHEIVNDQIDGKSILVSFCPLCNAARVYDTTINGKIHHFGVSGKLRHSDMVMWDHETESWWQQLTGEGIVGAYSGHSLKVLPAQLLDFESFAMLRPEGSVLSQNTGHDRDYGLNPYVGYDSGSPFFPVPSNQSGLGNLERVVGFMAGGKPYALHLTEMKRRRFVRLEIPGQAPRVIFHLSNANSALDRQLISSSKEIPHVTVWTLDEPGSLRKTSPGDGGILDKNSGIWWNAMGEGFREGKKVKQLSSARAGVFFSFAWFGFYPDTTLLKVSSKK